MCHAPLSRSRQTVERIRCWLQRYVATPTQLIKWRHNVVAGGGTHCIPHPEANPPSCSLRTSVQPSWDGMISLPWWRSAINESNREPSAHQNYLIGTHTSTSPEPVRGSKSSP